ncbi:hypothetical protein FA95DRAFT_519714 [Auriscalpium vulgare]|uniref:Uncharacterized protein n=1 Tax=Auriscalpium vulgare TaxID=40419 RepID=A0ACB8S3V7_9AGAM|nr:hypothetical protein FA95DRAFT_519714 [Auriscalpium vulgare]
MHFYSANDMSIGFHGLKFLLCRTTREYQGAHRGRSNYLMPVAGQRLVYRGDVSIYDGQNAHAFVTACWNSYVEKDSALSILLLPIREAFSTMLFNVDDASPVSDYRLYAASRISWFWCVLRFSGAVLSLRHILQRPPAPLTCTPSICPSICRKASCYRSQRVYEPRLWVIISRTSGVGTRATLA